MLTGPDFRENHVLDDGTPIGLRHVRPEDAAELKRGFERLSPSSRYRRFLGGLSTLSDEQLRYLTCVDGRDHVAIVAVTQAPDTSAETGLGIARFVRTAEDPTVAEAAITVMDDVQGRGLGRILGLALARAALERGVKRFRGEVLTDNVPLRQLLEEVGAVVRPVGNGSLVFDVDLVAEETPGASHRREIVARRLLRAASSHLVGLMRGLGFWPSRSPGANELLPQDVLSFWFGATGRPREEWFRASDAFDAEVRSRFGDALERAARGDLDDWRATPRGRLALVLVLDQLSRNAYRGTPTAFAQDRRARALALEGLDAGEDGGLTLLERSFLYMPLMHAEDPALQERGVALFEELARTAPPELADYLESAATFARAHRDIVARFRRFPHRNAVLGRESTAEESEFVKQPGSAF